MFNPAPSFASHSWIGADIHGAVTYQSANTRSFTIAAVQCPAASPRIVLVDFVDAEYLQ